MRLIYQYQGSAPYNLIGWCAGGVLAFEVARQLTAAGHEVSLLAMIDTWAPGHSRRLPRLRAILADYSYRWQLIRTDWRKVTTGEHGLATFLKRRELVKKLLRWVGHSQADAPRRVAVESGESSPERYDQWLLGYIEETAESYEPKLYPGRITLFRSAGAPTGLFLDPQMGWGNFSSGGVDVAVIHGDHFTMFKGQGLEQMAKHIAAVADVPGHRTSLTTVGA